MSPPLKVTNIEFQGDNSEYLWVHFGFIYFFTAVVCWRLWAFLLRMVALRTRYLRRLRRQTIEDDAAVVVGSWGAHHAASAAAAADAALDPPSGIHGAGNGTGAGPGGDSGGNGGGGIGGGSGGGGGSGALASFGRSMSSVMVPLQVHLHSPPLPDSNHVAYFNDKF